VAGPRSRGAPGSFLAEISCGFAVVLMADKSPEVFNLFTRMTDDRVTPIYSFL
jgi:hypothetical protein